MLSAVLGRQMVEPTHSPQGGGFLQRCGTGRRCNSNVLTSHRTDCLRSDILPLFSSGTLFLCHSCLHSFWHNANGEWELLWLDQLCLLGCELDCKEEIISAAEVLLGEENQWRDVLIPSKIPAKPLSQHSMGELLLVGRS